MTLLIHQKFVIACTALAGFLLLLPPAMARDGGSPGTESRRYIVELQDPPLAAYQGQVLSAPTRDGQGVLAATAREMTGESKLNMGSQEALAYLEYIGQRHQEFRAEASLLLGRPLSFVHQYRITTNGMALELSPTEAGILAGLPLVKSLSPDSVNHVQTFAGPQWIGADELWTGSAGLEEKRGEGVIVGVLDSGINWDHPSFTNPSTDGYSHTNPLGGYLGLCNDFESGAQCNDKLIGVYDFVEDDPSTEDVLEEYNDGKDNDGHGSHTAAIAAGNPVNTFYNGYNVTPSGVAPRANLITYRVCYIGDPAGPDTGGCAGSAILAAIEQAVTDGVDVINYSIGSGATNPWSNGSISQAYLNARSAGIFVATSAGNDGPNEATVGSPANAPWIVGVGSATHNVTSGSLVQGLTGGDSTPPGDLVGASNTDGIGQRKIVHARDYGNALCGTGEPELQPSCAGNLGESNPWDGQKPFNGEIVVCDRGTYGRVEKGKNLQLAGAGGYILANTDEQGGSVVADNHCLPATHIGDKDGDELRNWLASGSGHEGNLSGAGLIEIDSIGDQVSASSSRGPGEFPVDDVLKPNLIAPGVSILSASDIGQSFITLSGTSMSSPHVAGAAALLKSIHPDWSVSQLISAIETTAIPQQATDRGIEPATVQVRGAGRPQLGDAANAGLFLDVTITQFMIANPAGGGNPGELNMAGLVDASCQTTCGFIRTVTDQKGGGSWTATAIEFPDDIVVDVSPGNFTVGNGQSRSLEVVVDLSGSPVVGEWISGRIKLSSTGSPDQFLTVSVYSDGGELPQEVTLSSDLDGGWQEIMLSDLVALPDATFSSGGLVKPTTTANVLAQDPTDDNPYDGGEGSFTVWYPSSTGILWLYAETLASTSIDLDLFVGRDDNGDGSPQEFEELCTSTSSNELELCELYDLPPGDYWIVVQNWEAGQEAGDEATLVHAAIEPSAGANFAATGPGITNTGESFPLRLSWNNVSALPGEVYFGAVGVGSSRETPNNIGVIPIRFNRTGIAGPETFPLMNGSIHQLALAANSTHDRVFIDIPPGASQLTVEAGGANGEQNDGLVLELKRLEFSSALDPAPFAASPAQAPALVSAQGTGGVGPSITVVGVDPGRWYAVLTNTNVSDSSVRVRATAEFQGAPLVPQPGLWYPGSRPDVRQGYEYNAGSGAGSSSQALLWYTYDELGRPAWYIAGAPASETNIWTAELLRFTNDGEKQQPVKAGYVSVTNLGEKDQMFSYMLFGKSGSERMLPISSLSCPRVGGSETSYSGLWYPGFDGLGGASVLVNAETQSQIHYLFDDTGSPRWLAAAQLEISPTATELPLLQFSGYCAVCEATDVTSHEVGVLERAFLSETEGSWTLDYLLKEPLSGSVERTDSIMKLTDRMECL
jgi:subtilisin family serine protease